MKNLSKTICAAVLAAGTMAGTANFASAANPNFPGAAITKLNSQGFHTCKALGNSGYTATAHGQYSGGNSNLGVKSFRLRTCFETKAQCDHFVSRLHHTISKIERLYRTNCESRHG